MRAACPRGALDAQSPRAIYTTTMAIHHQTHIPDYEGSYALLSASNPTDRAIVFVHGFWGDSYNTWQEFQILADECSRECPWVSRSDLYFLQYQGATNYVGLNADILREFLMRIFPTPPEVLFSEDLSGLDWIRRPDINPIQIREGPYKYSDLVLVGHSLGGLIIRKLIRDEVKRLRDSCLSQSEFPLLSAEVRLISPAHLGFRPAGPLGMTWKLMNAGTLLRGILSWYRAFNELQPDSHIINIVRSETEQFALDYPELPSLTADVLWADHEDLVIVGEYQCDHAPTYAHARTNHLTVCKPRRSYLKPLEFVGGTVTAHGA